MRKLASIRRIAALEPIEGADRIEVATVDGWKVVVKKGEFEVGELCVYLEIDSWVPNKIAPFLTKEGKEPSEYQGVKGERLRTVRLRKQISQGLILARKVMTNYGADYNEGDDVTKVLGVLKWEREEKEPRGPGQPQYTNKVFPTHLFPKTDQERIQNVFDKRPKDHTYEVTLKLDGSSCSIFRLNGKLRVCSRNLELPVVEKDDGFWTRVWKRLLGRPIKYKNTDNHFVAMALKYSSCIPEGWCFQGELCGPGIQNNYEKLKQKEFFVYDVINLSTRAYLSPTNRRRMVLDSGMKHVPVVGNAQPYPESVELALLLADNPPTTMNRKDPEGLVYKSNQDPTQTFKVISNNYLLKNE
jgi:RNA ligase (TIGR02306 family)